MTGNNKFSKFAQTPASQSKPKIVPATRAAPTDEPATPLNTRVPKTLHRELKKRALEEDRTLREVVIEALMQYLNVDPNGGQGAEGDEEAP
ncbi:hypothetical protein GSY69_11010 [Brevibacterium sp. 5221]|uniref:CopG family transcriptional regulator n=1 Tax=Brevibacterium rongguiense TaxID=2695267 RepID=A0A6N9H8X3_9MICO|nr:hypothetical protein [Brevibacterium rongguiense]MYM20479.1 hypothetical protein [Brevibacterium rongguiense]